VAELENVLEKCRGTIGGSVGGNIEGSIGTGARVHQGKCRFWSQRMCQGCTGDRVRRCDGGSVDAAVGGSVCVEVWGLVRKNSSTRVKIPWVVWHHWRVLGLRL